MTVGLRDAKGAAGFPPDGTFKSCQGWMKLVLPEIK
jgi:hypothetical protein